MKGYFVYMFLDKEENPLYIGSATNLVRRVKTNHFLSEYGNLSEECIYKTNTILYHECVSSEDMKVKERYLINKLEPLYNISLNNKNKFSFEIPIEWMYLSFNIKKVVKERENKILKNKISKKTFSIRIYENDFQELYLYGSYKFYNRVGAKKGIIGWDGINLGTTIGDGIQLLKEKVDFNLIDGIEPPKRKRKNRNDLKIRISSAQLTEEEYTFIKKYIDYKIIVEKKEDYGLFNFYSDIVMILKEEHPNLINYLEKAKKNNLYL